MSMMDVQQRRFRRAGAMTALVILGALSALWATERANAEDAFGEPTVSVVFESVRGGNTLNDAMKEAGFGLVSEEACPEWFAREVLDPDAIQECYATDDFEAVFVNVRGAPVRTLLEERGWQVVTDDGQGMMSLVKDEGECLWMTACVSGDGEDQSQDVVLRIKHDSHARTPRSRAGDGS